VRPVRPGVPLSLAFCFVVLRPLPPVLVSSFVPPYTSLGSTDSPRLFFLSLDDLPLALATLPIPWVWPMYKKLFPPGFCGRKTTCTAQTSPKFWIVNLPSSRPFPFSTLYFTTGFTWERPFRFPSFPLSNSSHFPPVETVFSFTYCQVPLE